MFSKTGQDLRRWFESSWRERRRELIDAAGRDLDVASEAHPLERVPAGQG
jgi:hypothetical protein